MIDGSLASKSSFLCIFDQGPSNMIGQCVGIANRMSSGHVRWTKQRARGQAWTPARPQDQFVVVGRYQFMTLVDSPLHDSSRLARRSRIFPATAHAVRGRPRNAVRMPPDQSRGCANEKASSRSGRDVRMTSDLKGWLSNRSSAPFLEEGWTRHGYHGAVAMPDACRK
jgi:hypothetical protein